jgi:hypothetical protein
MRNAARLRSSARPITGTDFGSTKLNASPVSSAWVPRAKQGKKSLAVVLQPKSLLARYRICGAGLSAGIWHSCHNDVLVLFSYYRYSNCHSCNVGGTCYQVDLHAWRRTASLSQAGVELSDTPNPCSVRETKAHPFLVALLARKLLQ